MMLKMVMMKRMVMATVMMMTSHKLLLYEYETNGYHSEEFNKAI